MCLEKNSKQLSERSSNVLHVSIDNLKKKKHGKRNEQFNKNEAVIMLIILQIQSRITWEGHLNEGLCRLVWPVGMAGKDCLHCIV